MNCARVEEPAAESAAGGGEVGPGAEADKVAFLLREAVGTGDRFVVGDSEVAVRLDSRFLQHRSREAQVAASRLPEVQEPALE